MLSAADLYRSQTLFAQALRMQVKKAASILLVAILACAFSAKLYAQPPVAGDGQTVILISMDGFRADYLEKYNPPAIGRLARGGTRARWMKPAYPTKTFPNHYTIVTGLYPDNHGMIENNMYDAGFDDIFGLGKRKEVMNPRWWGGEPIWNTAQKQGQISAAFFWPGSEAAIGGMRPTYWRPYDHDQPNNERVDTVLSWLDMPRETRPTMITMYFADVDDAGHRNGPDSPATGEAVMKVDAAIQRLMAGLSRRGLADKVNLIIVSDHGMAPYKMRDAVVLDKMFDPGDAERVFWVGEFTQIFPRRGREKAIYDSIKKRLPQSAYIYRRGNFPKRYKFGRNKRIAPIVVIPREGTIITTTERYELAASEGRLDQVRGGHGYDNELVSMRATFVGHGPAFRRGFIAEPFEAVDVYVLLCRILRLTPAKNDGKFHRIRDVLDPRAVLNERSQRRSPAAP
jgi:predicted AlkP superfamily pyrophosphatase or phosphodiesterase